MELDELRELRDGKTKIAMEVLQERIDKGTATYADVQLFAGILGDHAGEMLCDALLPLFPLSQSDGAAVRKLVIGLLRDNHGILSELSAQVQARLNRKARIGLEAVRPVFNAKRANGLATEIIGAADFNTKRIAIRQQVENAARAVVDDVVKANANTHWATGLKPKITRVATGKCCEWCSNLAGVYAYPNLPDGVYRRHTNCDCVVLYDPGNGARRRTDVWTKQAVDPSERIRQAQAMRMQRQEQTEERKELYRRMKRR